MKAAIPEEARLRNFEILMMYERWKNETAKTTYNHNLEHFYLVYREETHNMLVAVYLASVAATQLLAPGNLVRFSRVC